MHPLLPDIKKNFAEAEKIIKQIERLGEGIAFPAVNQLRYVSYHLLRALSSEDEDYIDDEMREALYHTHRAIHDSSEIGIVFLIETIREFQLDYKTVSVTDVVPEWIDILKQTNEAKNYISTRTENSVKENALGTDETHPNIELPTKRYRLYFRLLLQYADRLKIARVELNKKVTFNRRAMIISVATLGLSLLGILISLIF